MIVRRVQRRPIQNTQSRPQASHRKSLQKRVQKPTRKIVIRTNKRRPIDIPRRLTKKINRRIGNLPNRAPPSQRNEFLARNSIFLPRQTFQAFCASYGPWGYDVGGNASGAEFDGYGIREGIDAGFSDVDVRLHRGALVV